MNFSKMVGSRLQRAAASSGSVRAARAVGAAVLGAVLLTACGGGSSQQELFQAKRLLSFGDEASVLTPAGKKYGVNGLNTSGVIDCQLNPLWIQSVAAIYGFGFPECSLTSSDSPRARTFASVGAVVGDVTAQVEAQVAAGGFRDGDIATVLVGFNDILALYRQYPARGEAEILAEASNRGRQLAEVVNRLVGLGVKVLVSDLPDIGLTPFAQNQKAQFIDIDRAALLSRLTTAFNEQLGVNVVLDGRFVGLVQAQLRFQSIERSSVSFDIVNITQGICLVALPDCTDATVTTGLNPQQSLWADDLRLAPGAQAQLAELAVDRARRNPF